MNEALFAAARKGWLDGVEHRPSPHFDERPDGIAVDLLVLHFISLPRGVFGGGDVERLFMGAIDAERPGCESLKGLRVSPHFFIRRTGEAIQFVGIDKRAWHAGLSNFRGRDACNDFSIGIELEGTEEVPFEEAQYRALAALVARLRRLLPFAAVTGHEHIAPGRKIDPGPFFDWSRVRAMLAADEAANPELAEIEVADTADVCDREMMEARGRALAAKRR